MRIITTVCLSVLALDAVYVTIMEMSARLRERRLKIKTVSADEPIDPEWYGEDWMYRDITDEEFRDAMENMMEKN